VIFADPKMAALRQGAADPRFRRGHPRSHGLHPRAGHGYRRARDGMDQGRDRPHRRAAA
jgi:hypothetical protein